MLNFGVTCLLSKTKQLMHKKVDHVPYQNLKKVKQQSNIPLPPIFSPFRTPCSNCPQYTELSVDTFFFNLLIIFQVLS